MPISGYDALPICNVARNGGGRVPKLGRDQAAGREAHVGPEGAAQALCDQCTRAADTRVASRAHLTVGGRLGPFIEKRPQSLRPLLGSSGEWGWAGAILGSGATVTVIPPHVGAGHDVMEGEGSEAGVKYEVASGKDITNLGEKFMAIMTAHGDDPCTYYYNPCPRTP